jgi:hypothetical protein
MPVFRQLIRPSLEWRAKLVVVPHDMGGPVPEQCITEILH